MPYYLGFFFSKFLFPPPPLVKKQKVWLNLPGGVIKLQFSMKEESSQLKCQRARALSLSLSLSLSLCWRAFCLVTSSSSPSSSRTLSRFCHNSPRAIVRSRTTPANEWDTHTQTLTHTHIYNNTTPERKGRQKDHMAKTRRSHQCHPPPPHASTSTSAPDKSTINEDLTQIVPLINLTLNYWLDIHL